MDSTLKFIVNKCFLQVLQNNVFDQYIGLLFGFLISRSSKIKSFNEKTSVTCTFICTPYPSVGFCRSHYQSYTANPF